MPAPIICSIQANVRGSRSRIAGIGALCVSVQKLGDAKQEYGGIKYGGLPVCFS
jgi:hypothetical protein